MTRMLKLNGLGQLIIVSAVIERDGIMAWDTWLGMVTLEVYQMCTNALKFVNFPMTASTLGKLILKNFQINYPVIFSFDKANNKCYLKSEAAETADAVYLSNYQTTTKGCLDSNCVLEVSILNFSNNAHNSIKYDIGGKLGDL